MIIEITDQFKVLKPEDGKKLYNGETYTDTVYMPIDGDVSIWVDADYNPIIKLSRDKLFEVTATRGLSDIIINALSNNADVAKWFYGTCDYFEGSDLAIYLQNLLQLTDEEMDNLIEECKI